MNPNKTKAKRAATAMREAMANGASDRMAIIESGARAIGGQECDSLIALMVWRAEFEVTAPN